MQIMNLLNLAPDIQEALLFLPQVNEGRDPVSERELREIVAEMDWKRQRRIPAPRAGFPGGARVVAACGHVAPLDFRISSNSRVHFQSR